MAKQLTLDEMVKLGRAVESAIAVVGEARLAAVYDDKIYAQLGKALPILRKAADMVEKMGKKAKAGERFSDVLLD